MKDWLLVQGAKVKKMTMKKAAAFTVTRLNVALMTSLVKAIGREEALQQVFDMATEMGHEFMLELYSNMPSNVERTPGIGASAWLMFTGKKPMETIFHDIKIADYDCKEMFLRDDKCTFCEGVVFDTCFCNFAAGAFQGASQTWVD